MVEGRYEALCASLSSSRADLSVLEPLAQETVEGTKARLNAYRDDGQNAQ